MGRRRGSGVRKQLVPARNMRSWQLGNRILAAPHSEEKRFAAAPRKKIRPQPRPSGEPWESPGIECHFTTTRPTTGAAGGCADPSVMKSSLMQFTSQPANHSSAPRLQTRQRFPAVTHDSADFISRVDMKNDVGQQTACSEGNLIGHVPPLPGPRELHLCSTT